MSNSYFDMLQGNIDSFGVITQNAQDNWDGGDTIQREGMFMCAMQYHLQAGRITQDQYNDMANRYVSIINKLNYENGWSLRRHPNPAMWYYYPNRMSRDQMTSNICALGFAEQAILKDVLLKHMLLRGGILTTNTRENGAVPSNGSLPWYKAIPFIFGINTPSAPTYSWKLPDLTDPSIWGAFVRGMDWKILWPTLWLSDWILVANALLILYQTKQGTASNDQLSFQMLMLQSNSRMNTWVAKLAMWIYLKTNPQVSLDSYFAPANDGPQMNNIYRQIWASPF